MQDLLSVIALRLWCQFMLSYSLIKYYITKDFFFFVSPNWNRHCESRVNRSLEIVRQNKRLFHAN